MPDYRLFFESSSMSAHHLQGVSHIVTISKWIKGKVGHGAKAQKKPVIYFKERELPLVVNKTIGAVIATLYGKDIDQWIGKRLEIYPTTTQFGPDIVDCIRVKPHIPKGKTSDVEVPAVVVAEPELTDKIRAEMEKVEASRGE